MAEHTIPVDLLNPGQVFACLGFLEAADALLGNAEGGFDWRDEGDVRFALSADGKGNPFGTSLDTQGVFVNVSPCVEILAAIGLEHARPVFPSTYEIRYAAWGAILPLELARVALTAHAPFLPRHQRRFFLGHLGDDQQYKKCFPAQEEFRA